MSAPKQDEQRPSPGRGEFYRGYTFEELARAQGVRPAECFEALLGGWPSDEVDDGFEEAVAKWRGQDLEPQGRS